MRQIIVPTVRSIRRWVSTFIIWLPAVHGQLGVLVFLQFTENIYLSGVFDFSQLWNYGMAASGSEILRLGENNGILGFSKGIIYL